MGSLSPVGRCVLLLRGINVGGRNKLPMAKLRACLEDLGGTHVETYLQSGNVAVTLPPALEKTIETDLGARINVLYGFEPAVLRITPASLKKVVDRNPFPIADKAPATVHVWFLETVPAANADARLDTLKAPGESFKLDGTIFYLHAPDGIGRSKLAARAEKVFGCAATSRNWRTIRALKNLMEGKRPG